MKAVLNPFAAKLQLVPDNKDFVPYSGAVKDLDLGPNGLTVDAGTLFVDKTNHRVGIGTTSPAQKLTVVGNIGIQAGTNAFIGTLDNYALSLRTNNTDRIFIDTLGNVGIGTNPNSKLHVAGSIALPIVTKTTNYAVTASDYAILGDASSGAITITLPTAVGIAGRVYVTKKIGSSVNTVTVACYGTETIDGTTTYTLSSQYQRETVISNGSNWMII